MPWWSLTELYSTWMVSSSARSTAGSLTASQQAAGDPLYVTPRGWLGRGLETERISVTAPAPDPTILHAQLPGAGSYTSSNARFRGAMATCPLRAVRW